MGPQAASAQALFAQQQAHARTFSAAFTVLRGASAMAPGATASAAAAAAGAAALSGGCGGGTALPLPLVLPPKPLALDCGFAAEHRTVETPLRPAAASVCRRRPKWWESMMLRAVSVS